MSYRNQLNTIEGKLDKIITWIQKVGCPHNLEYFGYTAANGKMREICFACENVKEYDNEIDFLQAKHETMEAIIEADKERIGKLKRA